MKKIYILSLLIFTFSAFSQEKVLSDYFNSLDASFDRNIMLPNAQTLKEGEITLNDYIIIVPGISYGITDELQLSLTAQPFNGGMIFIPLYALSLKYKIADEGNYIFSTQLSGLLSYYKDKDDINNDGFTGTTYNYGAIISFLFDYFISEDLFLSVNISTNPYTIFKEKRFSGYLTADMTFLLFENFKIIIETSLTESMQDSEGQNYQINYALGFRIFSAKYSFDLYGLRSFNTKDTLPFFSFAARF